MLLWDKYTCSVNTIVFVSVQTYEIHLQNYQLNPFKLLYIEMKETFRETFFFLNIFIKFVIMIIVKSNIILNDHAEK